MDLMKYLIQYKSDYHGSRNIYISEVKNFKKDIHNLDFHGKECIHRGIKYDLHKARIIFFFVKKSKLVRMRGIKNIKIIPYRG